ncbi:hypothetical protein C0J52_24061 [Blattella germanica]|nr:hypothetical protein C0J52_24061 [Blattella germanica]
MLKKAKDDYRLPYFDEKINSYIDECLTKIVGEGCAKTVEAFSCVGNLTFEFDKLIYMTDCEEETGIYDEEDFDPVTMNESFRKNTLTDTQKNENGTLDQEKIYTSLIRYLGKQVTEDHLKKHISECSTEGKDEEGKCTKAFDSLNCLISLWDKGSGK